MQSIDRINTRIQFPESISRPSFQEEPLPSVCSYKELPECVTRQLACQSGFSESPSLWASRSRIHRGYDQALRHLAGLRTQTTAFISAIIDGGMQFEGFDAHPEKVRNAAKQALRKMAKGFLAFRHSESPNIKTLELLGRPKAELAEAYYRDISNQARQYVTEMFPLLDQLGDKGLLGRIRYSGPQSENAEFTFFGSKAIMGRAQKSDQEVSRKKGGVFLHNGEWWSDDTVTKQSRTSGVIQLRHAWHTHLLSDVSVVPVNAWKLPLPPRIKIIVDSIPTLLLPAARIVSGTVEYIRIVEKDLTKIPFEYSDTYVTEERTRHHDPAVVIGNWVIAGWCDGENPKCSLRQRIFASCQQRLRRVVPQE